jgi:hypothetical protein
MDLSQLPKLGKVAGIPGIALGVFVLVAGAVITASGILPDAWRGPLFGILAVGAVILAALAIRAGAGGRHDTQIATTQGHASPARNKDKTKTGSGQRAQTKGDQSPATNERG